MNDADIIVETIPVGPLQCNCTILGDLVSRKAIVVDPGGDAEILLERLVELESSSGKDYSHPCAPGSFSCFRKNERGNRSKIGFTP